MYIIVSLTAAQPLTIFSTKAKKTTSDQSCTRHTISKLISTHAHSRDAPLAKLCKNREQTQVRD